MKSFSPAGAAVKAYYGRGARTFGNPGGATSGNGSFNGGGGATPNMVLRTDPASPLGFSQTFGGVPIFGTLLSGGPPFVPAVDPYYVADDIVDFGPNNAFGVSVFGVLAQNAFTSVQVVELGYTVLTAAATFFTNGGGCGPSTVWKWVPHAGLLPNTTYSLVFA